MGNRGSEKSGIFLSPSNGKNINCGNKERLFKGRQTLKTMEMKGRKRKTPLLWTNKV